MEKLSFDVLEEILVLLDVEDLVRFKSVCKSWRSFISSPGFVNAHLKHSCNNDVNNHELGHRRIGMGISTDEDDLLGYNYEGMTMDEDDWLSRDCLHVVGSCNGLVCVCPNDAEFVVTNPSTREHRKLPSLPYPPYMEKHVIRGELCWGFGYDSSTDDYKVIAGFLNMKRRMLFHVLTLKSNTWKFLGQVKYKYVDGVSGILCGGALHWFLSNEYKKVIISLNLSTEEFKETPQPVDEEYHCEDLDDYKLGVIDGCLCIFWDRSCFSSKKWVMKNNRWERYNYHYENKYDIAHGITSRMSMWLTYMYGELSYIYGVNDGERVPSVGSYIRASTFVKSLVSPYPLVNNNDRRKQNAKQQEKEKSNIRKRKRNMGRKMSCKPKKPLMWILYGLARYKFM